MSAFGFSTDAAAPSLSRQVAQKPQPRHIAHPAGLSPRTELIESKHVRYNIGRYGGVCVGEA
jgi:hypothetical protein